MSERVFQEKEMDIVVDTALNGAVYEIQKHLGIETGDGAGIFFSLSLFLLF